MGVNRIIFLSVTGNSGPSHQSPLERRLGAMPSQVSLQTFLCQLEQRLSLSLLMPAAKANDVIHVSKGQKGCPQISHSATKKALLTSAKETQDSVFRAKLELPKIENQTPNWLLCCPYLLIGKIWLAISLAKLIFLAIQVNCHHRAASADHYSFRDRANFWQI